MDNVTELIWWTLWYIYTYIRYKWALDGTNDISWSGRRLICSFNGVSWLLWAVIVAVDLLILDSGDLCVYCSVRWYDCSFYYTADAFNHWCCLFDTLFTVVNAWYYGVSEVLFWLLLLRRGCCILAVKLAECWHLFFRGFCFVFGF